MEKKRPWRIEDEEYVGNVWGWKFSFISLGIIVFMLLLMTARYCYVKKHPVEQTEPLELPIDNINDRMYESDSIL